MSHDTRRQRRLLLVAVALMSATALSILLTVLGVIKPDRASAAAEVAMAGTGVTMWVLRVRASTPPDDEDTLAS